MSAENHAPEPQNDTQQTTRGLTDQQTRGANSYHKLLRTASKSVQNFEKHLPQGYSETNEEEALETLRRGHTLERCYVKRLNISEEMDKTLLLRDVYIYELKIENATFNQIVSLQGCHIHRLIITNAHFKKTLSMKSASVYFTYWAHARFDEGVNAELLKSSSKWIQQQCTFQGRLRLWEASFADWVTFDQCTFHGRFDMRSAVLEAGLTLPQCTFHDDALFRGAHIAFKWEATGARFEKLIDFSKAKLNDYVYLDGIEQGPDQRWAFWNTVSEHIIISPQQVQGRLLSEEEEDYAKAMREYTVLKRSFEYGNYYSREDWAFYRFKVNERRARESSWSNPLSKLLEFADWLFLDWGCGYGTNPLRAIRTSLVMILFFALIFTLGFEMLHKPDASQLPFPKLGVEHLLNQASVSLFISLAAFTSGFGDLRDVAIGWMNFPLMLEALLGTLMWGLFVVAFGRKVIR